MGNGDCVWVIRLSDYNIVWERSITSERLSGNVPKFIL